MQRANAQMLTAWHVLTRDLIKNSSGKPEISAGRSH